MENHLTVVLPRPRLELVVALLLYLVCLLPLRVDAGELRVFAASSLTEVFTELAKNFEATLPGDQVSLHFAGSQVLRTQIEQGAPADVFASADVTAMKALGNQGLVASSRLFAQNQLVLVVANSSAARIPNLAGTSAPNLLLGIGNSEVPFGRYTRRLLKSLAADPAFGPDFHSAFYRNVVTEEANVKALVAKISLGEVDAGIVYCTDVIPALTAKVTVVPLPDEHNPRALYPVAIVQRAAQKRLAREFVNFLFSPTGQKIMNNHGFQPPRPSDG